MDKSRILYLQALRIFIQSFRNAGRFPWISQIMMCVPLLTHTGDRKNPEMMFVMANINGKEQDDKQFNGEI